MRTPLFIITLLLHCTIFTVAQQQAKRPMTVNDGLNMVNTGSAMLSPDGKKVLYSKSEADWEKNKRKTSWWMVAATGGEAALFLGDAGGRSFVFSPDGTVLYFLRETDKTTQLFSMLVNGGEATKLFTHTNGLLSFKLSDNGKYIAFLANEPRSKEDEKKIKEGDDAVFVDEGPNGISDGNWNALWICDLKTKTTQKITGENLIISDYDIAPDGTKIAYTARYENRRNQQYLTEIYLIDTRTREKIQLTENNAPEGGLRWAPDGKRLAYFTTGDKEWELMGQKITVMDVATRRHKILTTKFNGDVSAFYEWSGDGAWIFFNGQSGTNSNLFKVNTSTGETVQLTKVLGDLKALSFSSDRKKMIYTFSDFTTPADYFVSETASLNPTKLTDLNPAIKKELLLGGAEVIRWKSYDGMEIEGLLYYPTGYERGKSYPLIVHLHGGPVSVYPNTFFPKQQVYAGLGYVQFCPNYRGGSAYGDAFIRSNIKDLGGGEFDDIMSGVDYVIGKGLADSSRMAIRGWSWGGILTGWAVTHTTRFKAASMGAGVTDWIAEYANGFNHNLVRWYIGGPFWENYEGYRKVSSVSYIGNVTTPTLILNGAEDYVVSASQSMTFFTALKDQGKECRYIRFPREGHGFNELRHQYTRDTEEIKWFQKYVRNEH